MGFGPKGSSAAVSQMPGAHLGPLTWANVSGMQNRSGTASIRRLVRQGSPASGGAARCYTRCYISPEEAAPDSSETAADLHKRGGRYWDRTSDLFRVRDRERVRRGPSACVCAGQPAVGPQADVAGWGRAWRGWGTRWGTRRAGRQVAYV